MKRLMSAASIRRWLVIGSTPLAASFGVSCSSSGDTGPTGGPGPGVGAASAAGGTSSTSGTGNGAPGTGGTVMLGDVTDQMPVGPCMGLECQVPACSGNPKATSISGKVYDPAGKVPLYNVMVYVPNGPVMPLPEGAGCDRCGATITNPVTSAITDEAGAFKLEGVPAGDSVPLVIQVGKWRRQITVPGVSPCVDTAVADPNLTRLPRNKAEGDIPRIAISVGAADQMECLPLRMGLDASEFSTPDGDGRIHLYRGDSGRTGTQPLSEFDAAHGGARLPPSADLWSTADSLMRYDITILSCEGGTNAQGKPMSSREALYKYASQGGRVFASHFHSVWFENGPDPLPSTGTWGERRPNPAGSAGDPNGDGTPIPGTINQSFPKGEALAKWLLNVGASTALGSMETVYPRDNIQAVNAEVAREWITVDNPNFPDAPKAIQYMSFNTPIGVPEEQMCGREVYTNLHVAAVDVDTISHTAGFPASCEVRDLTAQEKAVAFMLFDLSSCVMSDEKVPKPPK